MKVGSSSLYFLPGQEEQLEKFSQHLPEKEKQALSLLKENKVLQDEKQEPAIRVALRSIKDFAFPLALKTEETKTIFWHYLTLPEEEAKLKVEELISPKIIQPQLVQAKPELKPLQPQPIKTTIQLQPPLQQPTTQTKKLRKPRIKKTEAQIQKPLIQIKEKTEKLQKIPEKSDFVNKIITFLQQQDIELLEELAFQKKEFSGKVRINTDLGKNNFLCLAKEKRKITENDLAAALQKAQSLKMPALLISPGELDKKAQAYLEEYKNLIKILKPN